MTRFSRREVLQISGGGLAASLAACQPAVVLPPTPQPPIVQPPIQPPVVQPPVVQPPVQPPVVQPPVVQPPVVQPPTTPPQPTNPGTASGANRMRQDAATLGPNHPILRAYGEAIRLMRALPSSDSRSLNAQATIHLQACPHGNWWFLPWHRAYLRRFEDICRQMLGDEGFALPYWNWSRDARIPNGFFDAASPLYLAGRAAGPNSTAAAEMVSANTVQQRVLSATSFELFGSGRAGGQRDMGSQGLLEGTPHNHIHTFVGGQMANFMAPVDPIFWIHHANVDRLWESWNRRGGANPTDSAWGAMVFNDFYSRTGGRIADSSASTSSIAGLGYGYDSVSVAEAPSLAGRRATAQNFGALPSEALPLAAISDQNEAPVVAGRVHSLRARAPNASPNAAMAMRAAPPSGMTLGAPAGFARSMAETAAPIAALRNPEQALIRVGEVDAPPVNENVIVRVFVNHPNLTSQTPVSDPHYVGSFGFFQTRFAAEVCSTNGLKASYLLDATEALRRVGATGIDPSEADVQLLAVGVDGRPLEGTEFFARQAEILAI